MPDIEGLLCTILRGEQPAWPFGQNESFVADVIDNAAAHGVLPLLHHSLNPELARKQGWPSELLETLRQQAIAQTMWELRHQQLLAQVLASLNAAGLKAILIKGTVLAYTLYPSPALRTRADSDLVIEPRDRFKVAEVLEANGFPGQPVSCEFLGYEASFTREEAGASHMLDLHWRIHYSQLQSRQFRHEELLRHAKPLPELSPHALGVDPVRAFLIACLHRANDLSQPLWDGDQAIYGHERLIWLYDLHLLAASMTARQLDELAALAVQKGLREICRQGFEEARTRFNTCLPDSVLAVLSNKGPAEPIVRYQQSGMLRQRWMDWLSLEGVRARTAYLWEHMFPPRDYMLGLFPNASPKLMLPLYARRLIGGVWRRMRNKVL